MIRAAVPRLIVGDADAAIDFYQRALDARLVARHVQDGVVVHAELAAGDALFTLTAEVVEWGLLSPMSVGGSSSLITLDVLDAPAVGASMVAEGAQIVVPIVDRPYGRCEGRVRDPFGHLWIPSHSLDASARPVVRRVVPDLRTADLVASADYYRRVIGLDVVMNLDWVVTLAAPGQPTAQLTLFNRDATAPVDAVVSIEVHDLDDVWRRAIDSGATIVHPRQIEPWGVERFFVQDPAGHVINVLGH
jgi:PhnB protein